MMNPAMTITLRPQIHGPKIPIASVAIQKSLLEPSSNCISGNATGCIMFVADREFLQHYTPQSIVTRMGRMVRVRDIGAIDNVWLISR